MDTKAKARTPAKSAARFSNVVISVGYSWKNDKEWKGLRGLLKDCAEAARRRFIARAARTFEVEDDDTQASAEKATSAFEAPNCVVRRLRARAGGMIWDDISRRIRESDLLVFDLTPPGQQTGTNRDNVMLELGYALSLTHTMSRPVIAVATEGRNHKEWIPSDLSGLLLAGYAEDPAKSARTSKKVFLAE